MGFGPSVQETGLARLLLGMVQGRRDRVLTLFLGLGKALTRPLYGMRADMDLLGDQSVGGSAALLGFLERSFVRQKQDASAFTFAQGAFL